MSSIEPAPTPPAGPSSGVLTGVALAWLAALLAALLASSPRPAAELWPRLAAGRALLEGRLPVGVVSSLDGPPAARPTRVDALYDVPLDLVHRLAGGPGLIALGAALSALLALLLARAGSTGANPILAGTLAVVAALALGPWLTLTPLLVSCLMLTLTLLLAERAGQAAEGEAAPARWWPIPLLVAAWANIDAWVVLGPVALALVALGQRLCGRGRAARTVALLTLLALAASLLSPNHVRAWDGSFLLGVEPALMPLTPDWFRTAPPAFVAAFTALVVLGLLAFVADRAGRARAGLPLWLALLGLALGRPTAAAFFVVVAGPFAARGLAGWAARFDATAAGRRWRWPIRGMAILGALLLAVAAWPGWLQGEPYGRRRWAVVDDPGLRGAVAQLADWQSSGALEPTARGFTLSAEAVACRAWLAPGTSATDLPPLTATEFEAVRTGLLGTAERGAGPDWRAVLRARHVNHLIVHSHDGIEAVRLVGRFVSAPSEWPLLYLRGRTLIVGWHDPTRPARDEFAALRLDLDRRAFDPITADTAPAEGSALQTETERSRWDDFIEPAPSAAPERDEAALYLALFDAQRPHYAARHRAHWEADIATDLLGALSDPAAGPPVRAAAAALRLGWRRGAGWSAFAAARDDGPMALPLLAVRAARRALAANPDDARSTFILGEAYLRLARATRERAWQRQLPGFGRMRRVQAIAAYARTLALRPDLAEAQGRIARLYRDDGALDLALRHLQALRDLMRARATAHAQSADDDRAGLGRLDEEVAGLTKEVARRAESLDAEGSRRVFDRAVQAGTAGLPGRALKILLASDLSEFGAGGTRMELDLLLAEGRPARALAWSGPEIERLLGPAYYHDLRAAAAAAVGDYVLAERELADVAAAILPPGIGDPRARATADIVWAIAQGPLAGPTPATPPLIALACKRLAGDVQHLAGGLRARANTHTVRGLLALEAGRIAEAVAAFRAAQHDAGAGPSVAAECLQWLRAEAK